ncbi:MAG: hypothetical protein NT028_11495, partial [candidate division Zixibacteria bacterium]|nr:hypothetical protein [candidate division Zixibacteria bacterium]
RIAALIPKAKILLVVRNQPSLLLSRYSEYLLAGGKSDFDKFVFALMGESGEGNRYFQNFYFEIIQILRSAYPDAQLHVIAQEQLLRHTAETERELFKFLALGDPIVIKKGFLSVRKSLSYSGMLLLRHVNRWLIQTPSIAGSPPKGRVPLFVYRNLVRVLRALDHIVLAQFSRGASVLLTAERRNSLLQCFRSDNLKLQQYLAVDLSKFGYLEPTSESVRLSTGRD